MNADNNIDGWLPFGQYRSLSKNSGNIKSRLTGSERDLKASFQQTWPCRWVSGLTSLCCSNLKGHFQPKPFCYSDSVNCRNGREQMSCCCQKMLKLLLNIADYWEFASQAKSCAWGKSEAARPTRKFPPQDMEETMRTANPRLVISFSSFTQ